MQRHTNGGSQDLLEQTGRILTETSRPQAARTTSSCCSPAKQELCCEPSDKDACCGTESTAGSGCGCQ